MLIKRKITSELINSLKEFPVVALIGPRQSGKTTLAKFILGKKPDAVYLDLELPSDKRKLSEPELYLSRLSDKLVIIDEIQLYPELFPLLRALVDQNRKSRRFLLLGSASKDLLRQSSESLAGRISYLELHPFDWREVINKTDIETHWWRGGYPLSLLSRNDAQSSRWMQAFLKTHLERDIPSFGLRIPVPELKRFWQMIAHLHGQQWHTQKLATSLNLSAPTILRYRQILEDLLLLRTLKPWHTNLKKRLVKSPKVYIRDSGLLHSLLELPNREALFGHPVVGFSWEGYVIEQISAATKHKYELYYWRSRGGAEVDLLLAQGNEVCYAVEIKYSKSPTINRGFNEVRRDVGYPPGYVIYYGDDQFPLRKDVDAISLTKFINLLKL